MCCFSGGVYVHKSMECIWVMTDVHECILVTGTGALVSTTVALVTTPRRLWRKWRSTTQLLRYMHVLQLVVKCTWNRLVQVYMSTALTQVLRNVCESLIFGLDWFGGLDPLVCHGDRFLQDITSFCLIWLSGCKIAGDLHAVLICHHQLTQELK